MKASQLSRLAGAVGAVAELEHVSLMSSTAERGDGRHRGTLLNRIETGAAYNRSGDHLDVRLTYDIAAIPVSGHGAEPEEGAEAAWRINAEWVARYTIPADRELTQEQITAFSVVTAFFTVHPYARQHVHWLTGAMGYTPLMLGVLRPPLAFGDDDDFEIDVDFPETPPE